MCNAVQRFKARLVTRGYRVASGRNKIAAQKEDRLVMVKGRLGKVCNYVIVLLVAE